MAKESNPKRKKILIVVLIIGAILVFKSGKLDGVLEKIGFSPNEEEVQSAPEPETPPSPDTEPEEAE